MQRKRKRMKMIGPRQAELNGPAASKRIYFSPEFQTSSVQGAVLWASLAHLRPACRVAARAPEPRADGLALRPAASWKRRGAVGLHKYACMYVRMYIYIYYVFIHSSTYLVILFTHLIYLSMHCIYLLIHTYTWELACITVPRMGKFIKRPAFQSEL